MTADILVTGASGNVGREVVRGLQAKNINFRIAAHNIDHITDDLGQEIDSVAFDFLDANTYKNAFEGIKRLFLIRPPQLANIPKEIAPTIQAAISAGVEHIVFLSLQGVENNKLVPHYKVEQLLLQSGIAYTFLRASFFMQNLSTTHCAEIRDEDKIALPVGDAPTSFIDVRDIASVAVRALTENGHQNKAYTLTGSESLNYYRVADIMTDVLDRPITYTNPSTIGFFIKEVRNGRKWAYTLVMTALYLITRFGNAEEVTHEVETILGCEPISFRQFVEDYQACWQPS